LVQDQDLWIAHQGDRQSQPLLLAPRKATVRRSSAGPQPNEIDQLLRASPARVEARIQPQDFIGPYLWIDAAAPLEHQADPGLQVRAACPWVGAQHADRASIGGSVTLHDLDRGRLSGALRTQERDHLVA